MNENMKVKWFDEEIEVYDEKRVVSKSTSTITLNYIPSKTRPLTVENKGVMLSGTEGTPSENQYVADRENGLLLFNSAMNGKVMVINYAAVGQWCINAEKVYTNVDSKGNVIETLEELIEENRSAIESIKTVGDAAKVVQEMSGAIDSVTGLVGNIIEGENINNTLHSTINTAKTTNSNLTNATTVATNKINEMNAWVNSHGDIVDLDNRVEYLGSSYNKIANEDIPKINESLETIENEKISKGTVTVLDIDKNKGKLDQTYMTDDFLKQIAGNTPINSTPADYSITQQKMVAPYLPAKVGKNLFDKTQSTSGYYVSYSTGQLIANSNYLVSSYIKIEPNTEYRISGTNEQLAFYKNDKSYLSGLSTASSLTVTPADAYYIRISYKPIHTSVQLEKNNVVTTYEPYYLSFDNQYIRDKIASENLDELLIKGEYSINLFNKNTVNANKYINASNGIMYDLANYTASDYIEIKPSSYYWISGTTQQFAIYNESKAFIIGHTDINSFNGKIQTPSNAKYIRLTSKLSELGYVQLEEGKVKSDYVDYGIKIKKEYIPTQFISSIAINTVNNLLSNPKEIIVKKDGGGDFSSLREALESITDANINNKYRILLYEGTYDVVSYYSNSEIENTTFVGLKKPDYVDIIGIGDVDNIIITAELNDTFSASAKDRVSTLATYGTGRLENITVIGKNLRYAVHDDYNIANTVRECINCKFIKDGGYVQAYGSGVWSGHKHYFENCYFSSTTGVAYSCHNNVNFAKKANIKMVGCEFKTENLSANAFRFGYLISGKNDEIELIGCTSNRPLEVKNEDSISNPIKFKIKGYANDAFTLVKPSDYSLTISSNGYIKTSL